MNKKGQPGASAASLVLMILLILIFYILFLPPQEREELLKKEVEKDKKIKEEDLGHTLLLESVGRLDFISRLEYEHNIQPIYLYSVTEATVLKTINPFYIKNGVGDRQNKIINFKLSNLENTDNMLLSFSAKGKGRLIIKLNDIIIFENEITTINVAPIELSKEYLIEDNTLEFDVSPVGWKFWKTNEYNLENIKITGDITDVSTQESRNVFQISGTEKHNLEEAYLRFLADCKPGQVGRLDVVVNGYEIFTGIPDCGSLSRKLYINKEYIKSGTNNVIFKTEKGSYLIDQIAIKTKLKEVKPITYYFELNATDYQNLKDNKVKVILELDLVEIEEGNVSDADFIINSHKISLNQLKQWDADKRRFDYKTEIDKSFLRKGSNSLSIKPKTTLEITEIRVKLEDID